MASIPPIETGVVTVKIGDNEEFKYSPARIRIKTGTTITFTNVGKLNHDATAFAKREWDTGDLASGESKAITFTQPGVYLYLYAPPLDVWGSHCGIVRGPGFAPGHWEGAGATTGVLTALKQQEV